MRPGIGGLQQDIDGAFNPLVPGGQFRALRDRQLTASSMAAYSMSRILLNTLKTRVRLSSCQDKS